MKTILLVIMQLLVCDVALAKNIRPIYIEPDNSIMSRSSMGDFVPKSKSSPQIHN